MKPKQEKQVQIPLRLLKDIDCIVNALFDRTRGELSYEDINYVQGAINEIQGKFEAIERHNTFTQYKTSEPDSVQREFFRQQYLEQAGINPDFTSKDEVKGL